MNIYGGITPEFICQPNKFNVKKDTDAKGTNGIITHAELNNVSRISFLWLIVLF